MKEAVLNILQCFECKGRRFTCEIIEEKYGEWRKGSIRCLECNKTYSLEDGIADFLVNPSEEITKEKEGAHEEVRIHTKDGESFKVTPESEKSAPSYTYWPIPGPVQPKPTTGTCELDRTLGLNIKNKNMKRKRARSPRPSLRAQNAQESWVKRHTDQGSICPPDFHTNAGSNQKQVVLVLKTKEES